jgi:ribosomal protein L12E/L44/L45/RPP1/RPP2
VNDVTVLKALSAYMLLKEGRPNLEPTVNDLVQLLSSVEIELCGADAEYVIKQVQCVGLEQALMEGLARLPRVRARSLFLGQIF